MTAARWVSLIVGVLIAAEVDWGKEDTNVWDTLCLLMTRVLAAAMVITPLVLEFLERK